MQKILTKKQRLEAEAKRMMICTARKKRDHCLTHCFHGIPHEKQSERDACHLTSEICDIQKPAIIKVTCRPLNAKERKEWIKKEMKIEGNS